jgi:hypothetical protein
MVEKREFENEELASALLEQMAESLMPNPIFEGYCGMDVDTGIVLIRQQSSVREDTEHSLVISYSIESGGSPLGITHTNLIGHAYQLPFLGDDREDVLEDFLRTSEKGGIIGNVGWYPIEKTVPPAPRERAA